MAFLARIAMVLVIWLGEYVVKGVAALVAWWFSYKLTSYVLSWSGFTAEFLGNYIGWPDIGPAFADWLAVMEVWAPVGFAWVVFKTYFAAWLACMPFRWAFKMRAAA
jgi:hypothetical protein